RAQVGARTEFFHPVAPDRRPTEIKVSQPQADRMSQKRSQSRVSKLDIAQEERPQPREGPQLKKLDQVPGSDVASAQIEPFDTIKERAIDHLLSQDRTV